VEEAKARLRIIEGTQELSLARNAIEVDDLSAAAARVESALSYLKEARSLTVNHVEAVTAVYKQAQELPATLLSPNRTSLLPTAVRVYDDVLMRAIPLLVRRGGRSQPWLRTAFLKWLVSDHPVCAE